MLFSGQFKVVLELTPLVPADILICQVFAFYIKTNARFIKQAGVKLLKRRVVWRKRDRAQRFSTTWITLEYSKNTTRSW